MSANEIFKLLHLPPVPPLERVEGHAARLSKGYVDALKVDLAKWVANHEMAQSEADEIIRELESE